MNSRFLKPGMRVLVDAEYNRAIRGDQPGSRWVQVAYAYPAPADPTQYAGTIVGFVDGHERQYRTNAFWIVEG